MVRSLSGGSDDEVTPLELFFDLVFVFAVSQLSEHLIEDLSWRSAGETLVLLSAVFGIWSFTSFGVSFPKGGRLENPSIFVTMIVALFVNAAIPRAFDSNGWAFLAPYLIALIGQTVFALVTASEDWLRVHYRAMLVWVAGASVLWVVGDLVPPDQRPAWWGAAAVVNIGGSWLGHPLPGRRFHSNEVSFEPGRMIERSRLLLIIALGETVLTIGTAVAETPVTVPATISAVLALVCTIVLWLLYFRGTDRVVKESASEVGDRLRVARIAMNSQLVVLAGLISLAVANELAIEEPLEATGLPLALALSIGPVLYLGAQAWYLHALGGRWSPSRLAGIAVFAVLVPLSAIVPALVAVLFITVILVVIAVSVGAESSDRSPAPTAAATS